MQLVSFSCGEQVLQSTVDLHNLDHALEVSSIADQMKIVGEVPNAFWKCATQVLDHSKYMQRLCIKHDASYNPCSMRNQIVNFYVNMTFDAWKKHLYILCKRFLCMELEEPSLELHDAENAEDDNRPVKVRRVSSRVRTINESTIVENMAVSNAECSTLVYSVYEHFIKTLVELGTFFWRYTSDSCDNFVLNDIDDSSGEFSFSTFCHVYVFQEGHDIVLFCTCSVYKLLQQLVQSGDEDVDSIALDSSSTCVHCRFVRETVMPMKAIICNSQWTPSIAVHKKLKDALIGLNCGVVQVGPKQPYGTIKFSVLDNQGTCEFV